MFSITKEKLTSVDGAVFLFGKFCLGLALLLAVLTGKSCSQGSMSDNFPKISLSNNSNEVSKPPLPIEDYQILITRNLFNIHEKVVEEKEPETPPVPINLRLVGVQLSEATGNYAIVEDGKQKQQDLFSVDEMLFGQAKLVSISTDSIIIEANGKEQKLSIEDGDKKASATASAGGSAVGASTLDVAVNGGELEEALSNMPVLLSQARAVPYFRDGKSVGMRLFAIRQGSMYEKLGLQNGDIIKGVNGTEINDPTQALKIFEQLRDERNIETVVERAGQDVAMKYQIR